MEIPLSPSSVYPDVLGAANRRVSQNSHHEAVTLRVSRAICWLFYYANTRKGLIHLVLSLFAETVPSSYFRRIRRLARRALRPSLAWSKSRGHTIQSLAEIGLHCWLGR